MTTAKDKNLESIHWDKVTNKPAILTQTDISTAVAGLIDDRGQFNASGNAFPATGGSGNAGAILKGDLWTISVAGTLGGSEVQPGDTIRALIDSPGSTPANWSIQQGNLNQIRLPKQDIFIPTAGQTTFTLSSTPALGYPVNAWLNATHQTNLGALPDFTVSGTTLTWSNANSGMTLATTDKLIVEYWY